MAKKAVKEQPVSHKPAEKRKARPEDDVGNEAFQKILHRAYIRDGKHVYFGEALALAVLIKTRLDSRRSKDDLVQVQKIMKDHNLES